MVRPLGIEVVIGELPEEGLKASKKPEVEKDFGLVVQDITPEIAKHLNLKEDRRGVIATDVAPGSPAQEMLIYGQAILLKKSAGNQYETWPILKQQ